MVELGNSNRGGAELETSASTPNHHATQEAREMAGPKSSKSPAFQYYPKDFLTDSNVLAMSLTEIGAYWKLISICWIDDTLPTSTAALARLVGVPHAHFSRLWPALAPCFKEKSGRLIHPRLERERAAQAAYRAKQSGNGKLGGRPKKHNPEKPTASSGLSQIEANESSSSASSTATAKRTALEEQSSSSPALVVESDWQAFIAAYPAQGRTLSRLASGMFFDARASGVSLEAMLAALDNHKRSEQWTLGKIPNLTKWLEERRWLQELPPPKLAATSSRTAGNVAAAQRFVARRNGGES